MEKIIFGAGCFWGVEDAFRELPGVISTAVGYSGGKKENPCYAEVCNGSTGHTEVVEVTYDPSQIDFSLLLNSFWQGHNPTHKMPEQYSSVIFYYSDEQMLIAQQSKDNLQHSGKYDQPVRTEILAAKVFYKAEEYHQQYYEKQRSKQTDMIARFNLLNSK